MAMHFPLHDAAKEGEERVVQQLLATGADVNGKDAGASRTALSWAAAGGYEAVVKMLLAEDQIVPDYKDEDGRTPLSWAAGKGHEAVVKLFLADTRVDADCKDENGWTPLSWAAGNGQDGNKIVSLLLEKEGVNPNSQDSDGRTPLSWAAEYGYKSVVEALLAKHDINPNSQDLSGRTPLSWAMGKRHNEIVSLLFAKNGVHTNSKDRNRQTPLLWAAKRGDDRIVSLLLENGTLDLDSQDSNGRTPLSWAAENGHDRVVNLLLAKGGASPDTWDYNRRTPLWWAAERGHEKVAKQLAQKDSITLHMLIREGNQALVEFLLHAGSNINACDKKGTTPLRVAIQRKDRELIAKLLKHMARPTNITIEQWLAAYGKEATDILQLSEGNDKVTSVRFPLEEELHQAHAKNERHLYACVDDSFWLKVPITVSTQQLEPNKLQTYCHDWDGGRGVDVSVSLWFPYEQHPSSKHFSMPEGVKCRIAWKIIRPTDPNNEPWRPIAYFSMLPNGWIPNDGLDFFKQFLFHLCGIWLELCQQADKHLTESRLNQLLSEGKSPDLMRRLAKDAQKWVELRGILRDQIREAKKFITDYCQYYNANNIPDDLRLETEEMEQNINNRIGKLDQTSRDLLQIEFAWASITETRISTRLGQNVMLLTYVSIFYLPLGYCSALWAIPNITDGGTRTPFIITSTIVGLVTLLVAFNLEKLLASKHRGPLENHEPKKAAGRHVKRGRPPKTRNKIENPILPLSLCPPPMIHPFMDQEASIEWGERLSDSEINSFVFKVKINSEPYVLKVFKFFDPRLVDWDWSGRLGENYPLEKAIAHADPFYAECRAYGRIKEAVDKGEIREKIAVNCHGYIFLNADAQKWLDDQGFDLGAETLDSKLFPIVGGAGKPRAIIKDFEIAGPDVDKQTPQQIRKSFRRVWLLNQLGIYNRDVRAENFRNGWLVDFDTSYTLPHDIYNALSPFEAEETRADDTAKFEDMLEEAGINMRFLPTKRFNLRPSLKILNAKGV
ncbi:hypothetical protein NUW58_g4888 [Xylaria curta]|uniref:Uncharacterized protein n=1 Tax=Xylaria curta TaxID=42375 RepID=A0ACC1P4D1_9PEZI|nr:hypothetical protein NUW58_g4888 [Xylaria curta]